MAKYRNKPIIIEAEKYTEGMEDGFASKYIGLDSFDNMEIYDDRPYINTLKGKIFISEGDYIITNIKNEKSICKADIFEMNYELVE